MGGLKPPIPLLVEVLVVLVQFLVKRGPKHQPQITLCPRVDFWVLRLTTGGNWLSEVRGRLLRVKFAVLLLSLCLMTEHNPLATCTQKAVPIAGAATDP